MTNTAKKSDISMLAATVATLLNEGTSVDPIPEKTRAEKIAEISKRDSALVSGVPATFRSGKILRVKHTTNKKRKGKGQYPFHGHEAVGTPRSIMPDEVDVELPFTYTWVLANNGFQYATYQFKANGLYDPDPNVGGTSFTGLADWAALYSKYRPISYKWTIMASNKEDQPLKLYVWNSTTLAGGSIGTNAVYYASNALGKMSQMGPLTGGNESVKLTGHVPISVLYGTNTVETDDFFEGETTGSDPVRAAYLGIATAGSVAQTSEGTFVTIIIKTRVRFYGRFILTA